MALVGIVVVLACVAGGFLMAGGNLAVLIQPSEFIVIIGAGLGAMLAMSPGRMRGRTIATLKAAFKDHIPKQSDYMDLLKLLFEIFQTVRRNGVLALEGHLADPTKSALFKKYPSFLHAHHAPEFLVEALEQMVNGVDVEDLDQLLETGIDTVKEEGHLPTGLVKNVGDSLPGIGIVAAVLGIINTMAAISEGPEKVGERVAAALTGTLLGIFVAYGFVNPLANRVKFNNAGDEQFLKCIKQAVAGFAKGLAPMTAVEVARRSLDSNVQPAAGQLEATLKAMSPSK